MIANAAKPLWLQGDLLMPVSSGRQVRYDLICELALVLSGDRIPTVKN